MTLNELLKQKKHKEIWQKYCGFTDLSVREFMQIQTRLMLEQINLMYECELGQRLMSSKKPASIEEFRNFVPFTTYDDYEDILLKKKASALPAEPVVWVETTWEGGKNPVKLAPYSEGMLKVNRATVIAVMLFATSKRKGSFSMRRFDRFVHGMAPMPYLTGLIPYVLDGEVDVVFMPDQDMSNNLSLSQRNNLGLHMGMQHGIDIFFGMGNILMKMTEQFVSAPSRLPLRNVFHNSLAMNVALSKAWLRRGLWQKTIYPKDLWELKGLIYAGTDACYLKDKLEAYWGLAPLEVFGGAELSCIAADTWSKNGMVMFPDVCFYEFIASSELAICEKNPHYVPKTVLMDEVAAGDTYELVISSLKGGAFLRYRVGYMFECLSVKNEKDGILLPQFKYLTRMTSVIDVAGFLRISRQTIEHVIELSKLPIANWFAVKELNHNQRPFLHLFIELSEEAYTQEIDAKIIKEHLLLYFQYLDLDEWDLESLFGLDPLMVTILPYGSIVGYENSAAKSVPKINPPPAVVSDILAFEVS